MATRWGIVTMTTSVDVDTGEEIFLLPEGAVHVHLPGTQRRGNRSLAYIGGPPDEFVVPQGDWELGVLESLDEIPASGSHGQANSTFGTKIPVNSPFREYFRRSLIDDAMIDGTAPYPGGIASGNVRINTVKGAVECYLGGGLRAFSELADPEDPRFDQVFAQYGNEIARLITSSEPGAFDRASRIAGWLRNVTQPINLSEDRFRRALNIPLSLDIQSPGTRWADTMDDPAQDTVEVAQHTASGPSGGWAWERFNPDRNFINRALHQLETTYIGLDGTGPETLAATGNQVVFIPCDAGSAVATTYVLSFVRSDRPASRQLPALSNSIRIDQRGDARQCRVYNAGILGFQQAWSDLGFTGTEIEARATMDGSIVEVEFFEKGTPGTFKYGPITTPIPNDHVDFQVVNGTSENYVFGQEQGGFYLEELTGATEAILSVQHDFTAALAPSVADERNLSVSHVFDVAPPTAEAQAEGAVPLSISVAASDAADADAEATTPLEHRIGIDTTAAATLDALVTIGHAMGLSLVTESASDVAVTVPMLTDASFLGEGQAPGIQDAFLVLQHVLTHGTSGDAPNVEATLPMGTQFRHEAARTAAVDAGVNLAITVTDVKGLTSESPAQISVDSSFLPALIAGVMEDESITLATSFTISLLQDTEQVFGALLELTTQVALGFTAEADALADTIALALQTQPQLQGEAVAESGVLLQYTIRHTGTAFAGDFTVITPEGRILRIAAGNRTLTIRVIDDPLTID